MNLQVLASLAVALACPTVLSRDSTDGFRSALERVPDVDGDGIDDLALAFRQPPPSQAMEVVDVEWLSRRSKRILLLSGRDGHLLTGLEGGEGFGMALAIAGTADADGDGHGDLWVSRGKGAFQISTGSKKVLASAEVDLKGDAKSVALDVGADRDGDGSCELLLGITTDVRGSAYVCSGKTGAILQSIAYVDGVPCWKDGEHPSEYLFSARWPQLGIGVQFLPDLDGDALEELAVGSGGSDATGDRGPNSRTLVFGSRDGRPIRILPNQGWSIAWLSGREGAIDLLLGMEATELACFSLADGSQRWIRKYGGQYLKGEATTLARVADVDGDGVSDFVQGANETGMDSDRGFAQLHSGASGEVLLAAKLFSASGESSNPDEQASQAWPSPGGWSGADVEAFSDCDGDGLGDCALWLPYRQVVQVVSSKSFKILWERSIEELHQTLER